jgi:hypothetical protein
LQFQDITAQQLSHAASILIDMEERMQGLATALDPKGARGRGPAAVAETAAAAVKELRAFDPNATMNNAEGRQALADSIFTP